MTEQEAKQRWCPFASSRAIESKVESNQVQVARWNTIKDDCITITCIAGDCMAWRKRLFNRGYCGLAGRP